VSCQLHTSALGGKTQYLWIAGYVGPRISVDFLKKMKITFTARNRVLDRPVHSIATIMTDLLLVFSTNMNDISKYSHTNLQKYPVFPHINEKYCCCESRQCSLLPYDMKALTNFNFYPEEMGWSFLWNTCNEISEQALSLPRIQQSSWT